MRAVVQTVSRARVLVDGEVVGQIGQYPAEAGTYPAETTAEATAEATGVPAVGLLVLLGVTHDDDETVARAMARKVYELRILDEERSASDLSAPVLVVSQFTLYGDARKGRRPTWAAAAPAELAEPLVAAFVEALRERNAPVATGRFRAQMLVESVNVGPRTVLLEL